MRPKKFYENGEYFSTKLQAHFYSLLSKENIEFLQNVPFELLPAFEYLGEKFPAMVFRMQFYINQYGKKIFVYINNEFDQVKKIKVQFLKNRLSKAKLSTPVIVITEQSDADNAIRAIKKILSTNPSQQSSSPVAA